MSRTVVNEELYKKYINDMLNAYCEEFNVPFLVVVEEAESLLEKALTYDGDE